MKRITTLFTAAAVLLTVSVPTVLASGGDATRVALKASKSFPAAKGSAKFKVSGQRELEVEVEHIRRLAGKRVTFFVGGKKLGSKIVSRLGAAQVERRGSAAPRVAAGTRVSVKTARGVLIVKGSF
jgi:hypothetical protein